MFRGSSLLVLCNNYQWAPCWLGRSNVSLFTYLLDFHVRDNRDGDGHGKNSLESGRLSSPTAMHSFSTQHRGNCYPQNLSIRSYWSWYLFVYSCWHLKFVIRVYYYCAIRGKLSPFPVTSLFLGGTADKMQFPFPEESPHCILGSLGFLHLALGTATPQTDRGMFGLDFLLLAKGTYFTGIQPIISPLDFSTAWVWTISLAT